MEQTDKHNKYTIGCNLSWRDVKWKQNIPPST
jgi:hypothetical protein